MLRNRRWFSWFLFILSLLPPKSARLLNCDELKGTGSFDNECVVTEQIELQESFVEINGMGSLKLEPGASLRVLDIRITLGDSLFLSYGSSIKGKDLVIEAENIYLLDGSSISTSNSFEEQPAQTSGTPTGFDGAGGGFGGRGASCAALAGRDPSEVWGGDTYGWSSLEMPWKSGSPGAALGEGGRGGFGGGMVNVTSRSSLYLNGSISSDGGSAGLRGGGGSGGSVVLCSHHIVASKSGKGLISAVGGSGYGGGGGGRISVNYFSKEGPIAIIAYGGQSLGCSENAGAAGTVYNVNLRSLEINNGGQSSVTATQVLETPYYPVWNFFRMRGRALAVSPVQNLRLKVHVAHIFEESSKFIYGSRTLGLGDIVLEANDNDGKLTLEDSSVEVFGRLQVLVPLVYLSHAELSVVQWRPEESLPQGGGEVSSKLLSLRWSQVVCTGMLRLTNQNLLTVGAGSTLGADKLMLQNVLRVQVEENGVIAAPITLPYGTALKNLLYCESASCPSTIMPSSEDCNNNSPFSLHICRAEEVMIAGRVRGSVVHVNVRGTLQILPTGLLSASGLGCEPGQGVGAGGSSENVSGGGGHGGSGGSGVFNRSQVAPGGPPFGSPDEPCELGSGSGVVPNKPLKGSGPGANGGGVLVIGSRDQPVKLVQLAGGAMLADGAHAPFMGSGGGSGGSLLVHMEYLSVDSGGLMSARGGEGRGGGGGGGGGRVHLSWANLVGGEKYVPRANLSASLEETVLVSGGDGGTEVRSGTGGQAGSLTTIPCPPGLYGILCEECPLGTYKEKYGSSRSLCVACPVAHLPRHAQFVRQRGGVARAPCPFQCVGAHLSPPQCSTPIEALIQALGGPYIFTAGSILCLLLLSWTISVARMQLIGSEDQAFKPAGPPSERPGMGGGGQLDQSLPFLESLNEVLESSRSDGSGKHVYRIFFQGSNSFQDPLHLPQAPPEPILDLVFEDAYSRFVQEVNVLAAFHWWEGGLYQLLCLTAFPLAWSWQQWRRKRKVQRLHHYVCLQYDHSCLRSCRARALYEGLQLASSPDFLLAYLDIFLGGDEKRKDLPPPLLQRLPLPVLCGGEGSYMAPFCLTSDHILTALISQAVPPSSWYRLVNGLNAQLRLVRRARFKEGLEAVLDWLDSRVENSPYFTVSVAPPRSSASSPTSPSTPPTALPIKLRLELILVDSTPPVSSTSSPSTSPPKLGLLLSSSAPGIKNLAQSSSARSFSSCIPSNRISGQNSPRTGHQALDSPRKGERRGEASSLLSSQSYFPPQPAQLGQPLFHPPSNSLTSSTFAGLRQSGSSQGSGDSVSPFNFPRISKIPPAPPLPPWPLFGSALYRNAKDPRQQAGASRRRRPWKVIRKANLQSVKDLPDYPASLFSPLLHPVFPFGHDAEVGLAMSLLLLADLSLSLLTLLQVYSISLTGFWLVLLVLPLTPLFSAAAGLNALFSQGPRKAAGLCRVYGIWNVTSMANPLVALIWGLFFHGNPFVSLFQVQLHHDSEYGPWWVFPALALVVKVVQARVVDRHVANLDVQDRTLCSEDANVFWQT